MGYLGKVMAGAAIGVAAVAAAPFTGGGSIFGAVGLAEALAGEAVVATLLGVSGASAGVAVGLVEDSIKDEQIKVAKKASFNDGINEAKHMAAEEVKKYADFYLATTALSYYVARCDGSISEEEQAEIDMDLDAIRKNADISPAVVNEMVQISKRENLTWEIVESYLNKVSVETLNRLLSDVEEIIIASDGILPEEEEALNKYKNYINRRTR